MSATSSIMLGLGTQAPPFDLLNTNKHTGAPWVASEDFHGQPLLVAFICNHCPYVVLIKDELAELAISWQKKGVNVVAISCNDIGQYPADAPEKMTQFSKQNKFEFPYLYDETQDIAKNYRAMCTPDFFLFNAHHKLVYRGQFDGARPGNGKQVSGEDLNAAVEALVAGQPGLENQKPSMGCSIKWQTGNEPDYF